MLTQRLGQLINRLIDPIESTARRSLLAAGILLVTLAFLVAACGSPTDSGPEVDVPQIVEPEAGTESATMLPTRDAREGSLQDQFWQPPPGTTWQWQLSGDTIDQSFDVDMYDIDLFESDAQLVSALGENGRRVVCYLSAGSWEEFRPDARQFPDSVIGKDYEGWPGERWLDIRQIELLAPIMRSRLDQRIDRLIDRIEAAADQRDWQLALRLSEDVLAGKFSGRRGQEESIPSPRHHIRPGSGLRAD